MPLLILVSDYVSSCIHMCFYSVEGKTQAHMKPIEKKNKNRNSYFYLPNLLLLIFWISLELRISKPFLKRPT